MKQAQRIVQEIRKVVIGKDDVIVKTLLGMLARGHILLEDLPGVGKTTLAIAFSRALALQYKRVQCTPDVMPSDITGFTIYNRELDRLDFKEGVALCNLLLADEINRASSRAQSALLEAMEEGRVTVDGVTHEIPKPFLVLATQNPVGSAGTQLLPDSQMDRFMLRLSLGYPAKADEIEMLRRKRLSDGMEAVQPVCTAGEILSMQREVDTVHVSDEIYDYVVRLIDATRRHPAIRQGGSPRASLAVTKLAQAAAWLCGRDYAVPDDVMALFVDAVAHRLVLTPQAKLDALNAVTLADEILHGVPAPRLS